MNARPTELHTAVTVTDQERLADGFRSTLASRLQRIADTKRWERIADTKRWEREEQKRIREARKEATAEFDRREEETREVAAKAIADDEITVAMCQAALAAAGEPSRKGRG